LLVRGLATTLPGMTLLSLIVLVASFIAGAIANAKQSGSLPASWVPYATVVGAFVASFGVSLNQSGGVTLASLVAAAFAGLQAVFAAGGGVAFHLHFRMGKRMAPQAGAK
jgi:hypothetical protein